MHLSPFTPPQELVKAMHLLEGRLRAAEQRIAALEQRKPCCQPAPESSPSSPEREQGD